MYTAMYLRVVFGLSFIASAMRSFTCCISLGDNSLISSMGLSSNPEISILKTFCENLDLRIRKFFSESLTSLKLQNFKKKANIYVCKTTN